MQHLYRDETALVFGVVNLLGVVINIGRNEWPCKPEKRVVELNHILRGAVVCAERHLLRRVDKLLLATSPELAFRTLENLRKVDDLLYLATSETIYRLLRVAYNHVHVAKSKAVFH